MREADCFIIFWLCQDRSSRDVDLTLSQANCVSAKLGRMLGFLATLERIKKHQMHTYVTYWKDRCFDFRDSGTDSENNGNWFVTVWGLSDYTLFLCGKMHFFIEGNALFAFEKCLFDL